MKAMKKVLKGMAAIAAIVAVAGSLFVFGCTQDQKTAVAKQLGLAAAVTWIGVDNPSTEQIATVKTIVTVIDNACQTNGTTVSYYASVYPVVNQYITDKLDANQQPMARLGAAFILTSLDTAFAMNPTWNENSSEALELVGAFCDGAKNGLGLSSSDPVLLSVKRQTPVRLTYGRK